MGMLNSLDFNSFFLAITRKDLLGRRPCKNEPHSAALIHLNRLLDSKNIINP